jgi:outer membrane protein assembly factor BamB
MKKLSLPLAACCLLYLTVSVLGGDWPAFRGPSGNGISLERGLPVQWSAAEGIAWAVELPMPGNSSPIVVGDRVFLTGAMEKGAERVLLCYDRDNGDLLWHNSLPFKGSEPTHETNPYCAATPASDGQRVFVWHGSAGIVAYDLDGRQLWHRDLGPFTHIWGNASSPVLFEDTVILYAGPGPRCLLMALDKATGNTIWERELSDVAADGGDSVETWNGSWSTPVLHNLDGRPELILSLPGYVAGYNPRTGQEYWRCGGLTKLVYTSPVVGKDVVVAMSGFMGASMGLRRPGADASGDVTSTHQLWRIERNPQRIGTGILIGEHLYLVNEPGVAECIEARTGRSLWKERLGKVTWGSIIYADTRLYATDSDGTTFVINPSPAKLDLIARNLLESPQVTRATPSFSDGQIFLRTYDKLYCIGHRKAARK